MCAMRRVTDPNGREWKVGRQWMPKRVRVRRRDLDSGDTSDPSGAFDFADLFSLDDAGAGIVIGLGLVVLVGFVLVVVFPIVAVTIELVLLLVLFVAGLVGRIVFKRPWHVIARSDDRELRFPVKGWRESGERVEDVADALAAGREP
jgi:hypothetical protein